MADFYRYPYTRPGGRSRSWPGSDFLSTDLPTERSPDWQIAVSPSYKNVDTSITLNSTTVSASYVMYADAATATTWTPTTGSGSFSATAATVALYGPFVDEIVELSSDRFVEAGSSFGDIGTEDFVIEITGRMPNDGTVGQYFGKFDSGVGWRCLITNGTPTFYVDDNVTEASDAAGTTLTAAGEWFHLMVICDRSSSTGLRIYLNGSMSSTPADCSAVGSITNAGSMHIGHSAGSGDFGVGHIAIWKQAAWLNGSDYSSVVSQRFQQVQGWYNASSTVTATPGDSHAWSDAYDATTAQRRLFRVGANWIPCRITADGAYTWAHNAVRCEHETDPTDINSANWSKNDLTISQDAIAAPLTGDTADGIVVSATPSGSAQISDSFAGSASVSNIVSFWAKKGSSDYIWVAFESGVDFISQHAIINLTNGTVERTHANRTWRTENWGNGWYRCIGWGNNGTSPTLYIGPCDSSTTYSTVSGDAAAVNTYLYGVNVCRSTLGAAVTPNDPPYLTIINSDRTADTLTFDVASADPLGDGIGSVWFTYKRPDTVTQTNSPLTIQDASATTHNITFTQQTDGTLDCSIADGVGTAGALSTTTALNDNTEREIRLRHSTADGAGLKVAGTEEATDTYTASPANLDKVIVKQYVGNIRLYRNRQY